MLRSFQLPSHGVSFNATSNYLTLLGEDRNSETSVIHLRDVQSSEPMATISSPGKVDREIFGPGQFRRNMPHGVLWRALQTAL